MKRLRLALSLLLIFSAARSYSFACEFSVEKIAEIMQVKATTTPDGVVRVGWPRKDVKVLVDGLAMRPFMGLGTWAAFQKTEDGAMVMGDTVVFQDEVNPAMDAAFANGLEVTGLHNHFFFDEPKVHFMHIGGQGCPDKLAQGVKAVWDAVKKVRDEQPEPSKRFEGGVPDHGKLDTDKLVTVIGAKGTIEDEVFKVTIGREAEMHGMKFGGSMGLTTWAAFAGTDDSAIIDGDFAMTASEVQPVLKALRATDINIVALHNHMVGEAPGYYFVHFWGKGKAADLANGFRAALDVQKSAKAEGPKAKHSGERD